MITLNKLSNATVQVALASGVGFVWGALGVKKAMLAPVMSGTFFALLTGGNLAVYYGTRVLGEALKMKAYKVMYLQFATLSLFNIAVVTAFVASGVFTAGAGFGLCAFALSTFATSSYVLADLEHASNPHRILRNALPRSIFEVPFFAADPGLDPRVRQEQLNYMEIFRRVALRRFVEQQILEEVIERSQLENHSNQATKRTDFANVYYQYQIEARNLLMNTENKNLPVYSKDEVEDMAVSALNAIYCLSIFNLINNIQEITEDKIVFKKAGGFDYNPEFSREDLNFLKEYNLFDKLKGLHESINSLTKKRFRWSLILQKMITDADLKNEDLLSSSKTQNNDILKQREQCNVIFTEINRLLNDFNSGVITAESSRVKWGEVFQFPELEEKK